MEKSEILQQWIEGAIPDPFLFQQRRAVYTHLLGTAHFAAMLAMKRGADSEAAELAGLLHDISTYLTGEHEDHARKGAALPCGFWEICSWAPRSSRKRSHWPFNATATRNTSRRRSMKC